MTVWIFAALLLVAGGLIWWLCNLPPLSESQARARELRRFKAVTPEERDWFLVGWDDHLLYGEYRSQPGDEEPVHIKRAYLSGWEMRRLWVRGTFYG